MDMMRLKRKAKQNLELGLARLRRWWSNKYKLPPNSPLFMEQTQAELQLEMFEDLMVRREELRQRLRDGETEGQASKILEQINAINKALEDEVEVQDDLIDQWERDLAEGRIPDLDAMPGV